MYGFIYPVFFLLNYVGILKYTPVFTDIANIKQQLEVFVTLSDHVRMNAYCTLFFNFYSDFGVFGIFLGSFIFGYFLYACIYIFHTKERCANICMLLNFNSVHDLFNGTYLYYLYD